jgi:hypothetical protein
MRWLGESAIGQAVGRSSVENICRGSPAPVAVMTNATGVGPQREVRVAES